MELSFASAATLLILVIDPFGSIPLFLAALKNAPEARRAAIVARECLIAFFVLLVFMLGGRGILSLLQVSETSLGIAGGIILFIIAIRIIFPSPQGVFGDLPEGEPFLVPLAIPLIAGPSALATVMLLASRWPDRLWVWVLALSTAVAISAAVLCYSQIFARILGKRGLTAIERLTGMLLTVLSVEMLLSGIKDFLKHLG